MHPIKEVLINAGYRLTDNGDFWKTAALYRNGKNPTSLSINKRTGQFWDFSAGLKGSAEDLSRLVAGKVAFDITQYKIEEVQETIRVPKYYPKEILKKLLPDYELFLKRGISKETLDLFEAGMAHSGKLNRRICFPIYDAQDRIVGFTGRWYSEDVPEKRFKWKHIGKKTEWTYPRHLNRAIIEDRKEIILLESIGDVLALWDAGIKTTQCIFGTALSTKQIAYIIGRDPSRIIIATNNDHANDDNFVEAERKGPRAARKAAKKLAKFFSTDKIMIRLPEAKDFGEMTKEEILNWYKSI